MVAPGVDVSAKISGFLTVEGTSIVDSNGQPVLLRGVNYPGYGSGNGGDPRPHSEREYQRLARLGFNVVRLPISWDQLEPWPGAFLKSYLTNYVDRDVRWAKKYGIYIILDMHQYNWARRFQGGGIPDWTAKQYPATEAGKRAAVSNFWINQTLQDRLAEVWRRIAAMYANEPAIAGYDLLNEPWIYTSIIPTLTYEHVDAFYLKVIQAIRMVDRNHIFFLEPANMVTAGFPVRERIVWSPHFYPLSFNSRYYPENMSILEMDLAAKHKTFVVDLGAPMWIGEFNAFMSHGQSRNAWLRDAVHLFEKYQVGWAWWAYRGTSVPACLYQPSC